MKTKKIGIIGSGSVGLTLAKGLKSLGFDIMVGSNHQEKISHLSQDGIHTGSFKEAAHFGEMIILAVKGAAGLNVLQEIGEENLKGKTILDTTNPIADKAIENGVLSFFTTTSESLMEQYQQAFPQANFVKALNSIGAGLMIQPDFESTPSMFICGDQEDAKKEASELLTLLGFEVEDFGKKEAARAIEPLCILWCIPGFLKNQWNTHAFKLLKKA